MYCVSDALVSPVCNCHSYHVMFLRFEWHSHRVNKISMVSLGRHAIFLAANIYRSIFERMYFWVTCKQCVTVAIKSLHLPIAHYLGLVDTELRFYRKTIFPDIGIPILKINRICFSPNDGCSIIIFFVVYQCIDLYKDKTVLRLSYLHDGNLILITWPSSDFHFMFSVLLSFSSLISPSACCHPVKSQYKDGLFRYGISIIKIRWLKDWLIFIMGIPILVTQHLYIEMGLSWPLLAILCWFPIRLVSTLRPRQNGRHFADAILNSIFLNENVWIPIKFSLKFVPKGPINNIPALVQIMAWRRPGDKHYLNQWWLVYWRVYASLGLNELNKGPLLRTWINFYPNMHK